MRILYLDLDTLRPDHLSCYGYRRQTSPHIDAIARRDAEMAETLMRRHFQRSRAVLEESLRVDE